MSLHRDSLADIALGDVLKMDGLLMGFDPDEPLLLTLSDKLTSGTRYGFTMRYMGIRIGTAQVTFDKEGNPILEVK